MLNEAPMPRVSVLMPTFAHARFIARAIESLLAQSLPQWELVIVDDGSRDGTTQAIASYLWDRRIRYHRLKENRGLGAALNLALDRSHGGYIAYLPADDLYYRDHLASLLVCMESSPDAVLAYAGVRHHYNGTSPGRIEGCPLQLVQCLHRCGRERWTERQELVTDDLERMFWAKLRARGTFAASSQVTCEWVDHPLQRHKLIREPVGGINPYRVRYRVEHPLRFHSSVGNAIDEVEHYRPFRERPDTPCAAEGLKILLVGELAYNAERVLAIEERGHKLYGLWMRDPYWYNSVGPLAFGHVQDIAYADWCSSVKRIRPDIIYALLNWQAVPFAHEVLSRNPGIPFVWHFKEGPFICLEKGTWDRLVDLYTRADGRIYSSPEMRDWFHAMGIGRGSLSLVLDGDLPKREWFERARSPRLSEADGEIHTVVPGRPIGLHPPNVAELAAQGIHLHFYGDFTHGQWRGWIEQAKRLAPRHLHLHPNVGQPHWVEEFSRYDAGWLHYFKSENAGEIHRANWDDLNYPARIATLACAGLPLLQRDNNGAIVATQTLARRLDISLFFTSVEHLGVRLRDRRRLDELREKMWRTRAIFTFDHHADRLINFFKAVIEAHSQDPTAAGSKDLTPAPSPLCTSGAWGNPDGL